MGRYITREQINRRTGGAAQGLGRKTAGMGIAKVAGKVGEGYGDIRPEGLCDLQKDTPGETAASFGFCASS